MKTKKIPIKSEADIKAMIEGGEKLGKIISFLVSWTKSGMTGLDIERKACELIKQAGGGPSFKKVPGYRWATCICVNDCVVHGVPDDTPFREGDVIGIDIGMYYRGFHTDTSWTKQIKSQKSNLPDACLPAKQGKAGLKTTTKNKEVDEFLKTGELALKKAIEQVKPGNRIGHLSKSIQETIEGQGCSVVRELIGHGVGKNLHERPEIPGNLNKPLEKTPILKPGMVLAIEVIYNLGKPDIYIDPKDGWTVRTKDGKISALFEKTVAVVAGGFLVLT